MPQLAKGMLLACVVTSMARATDSAAQSALGGSREQITVRSYNGRIWTPLSDPCSPRGGVAVCVSGMRFSRRVASTLPSGTAKLYSSTTAMYGACVGPIVAIRSSHTADQHLKSRDKETSKPKAPDYASEPLHFFQPPDTSKTPQFPPCPFPSDV